MHRNDLMPAINALEEELAALNKQADELRSAINLLCQRAGLEQRHVKTDGAGHTVAATTIKPDSFYGKRMQTAAREFLEMRKRAGAGPAKPRDIFDALKMGGFQFEAKDDTISMVSLRATLRKNSATFHKLPNGQYGLKAWYPRAKLSKEAHERAETSPSAAKAAPKRKKHRAKKAGGSASPRKSNPAISPFVINAMQDETNWTTERLRQEAIARGTPGVDGSTKLNVFHATLLGLRSRGLVRLVEKGLWRVVKAEVTGAGGATDYNDTAAA